MISLIATVLNEGDHLHRLMRSIAAQTQPPDEIVIVDGGSRDHTVALLHEYARTLPLRVIVEPGANISRGRNVAIAAAQGDIIAVTDAGVVLAPDWLAQITRLLLADPALVWVGGFFDGEATTPFELAMSATVLPLVDEINPATFLPSSRSVAFRKTAWSAVGGYPEWLDYCEDLVFDFGMREVVASGQWLVAGGKIELSGEATSDQLPASSQSAAGSQLPVSGTEPSAISYQLSAFSFVPEARVAFRPRGSLRSFFTQYYRYARGDGKADLWRKRHAIRYATYLVAAPVGLALGLLHPVGWMLLLGGAFVYLRQPYRRLAKLTRQPANAALIGSPVDRLKVWFLIPVIRVVGDVAKMLGYPVGWRWRLQQRRST
ncbi:MAG: glycosyltransferase [Anaerolineae bacterium]|nr:glycosyltransferase [Anaerolineae bacterium]